MRHKQNPSDEEIRHYMNFDDLLEKRKAASHTTRSPTTMLKWSIPVTIVTTLIIWFSFTEVSHPVVQNEKSKSMLPLKADSIFEVTDSTQQSHMRSPLTDSDLTVEKNREPKSSEKEITPAKENLKSEAPVNDAAVFPKEESAYIQAEPVDGYADLYQYFETSLVYPVAALGDSVQGVQTISFIINTNGKPEQIEVVNSLGQPFEKEAKRLIENMPAWKPATLDGKPVASKVSLPITFQIQKIKP